MDILSDLLNVIFLLVGQLQKKKLKKHVGNDMKERFSSLLVSLAMEQPAMNFCKVLRLVKTKFKRNITIMTREGKKRMMTTQ